MTPQYVRITCEWCGCPDAQIENTDYLLEGRFRIASCPDCDWIREYDDRDAEYEPYPEHLDPLSKQTEDQ